MQCYFIASISVHQVQQAVIRVMYNTCGLDLPLLVSMSMDRVRPVEVSSVELLCLLTHVACLTLQFELNSGAAL